MSPPPDVTGRISLAESGSRVNLQGVIATLSGLPVYSSVSDVRFDATDATGKLVFAKPISPGPLCDRRERALHPRWLSRPKSEAGGQEVYADNFEILTSAPLEIVLSNTAG